MLKITNDGRKLALDRRMINPMLPDFEGSKINTCVDNIHRIWEDSADRKSAQLVFCDLSTPKPDGEFSAYTDIRRKLIECGVPESEIAFIHDAKTETQKQELFKKVRRGEVRVLLSSTAKIEVEKPFAKEEELQQKLSRLTELNAMLDMDKGDVPAVGGEHDEKDTSGGKSRNDREER